MKLESETEKYQEMYEKQIQDNYTQRLAELQQLYDDNDEGNKVEMVKGYELQEDYDSQYLWHKQFWSRNKDNIVDFNELDLFEGVEKQKVIEKVVQNCVFDGVKTELFNTKDLVNHGGLQEKELSVKHEKQTKFVRLKYKYSIDQQRVNTLFKYLKKKDIHYSKIDWAYDYKGALHADIRD